MTRVFPRERATTIRPNMLDGRAEPDVADVRAGLAGKPAMPEWNAQPAPPTGGAPAPAGIAQTAVLAFRPVLSRAGRDKVAPQPQDGGVNESGGAWWIST